MGELRSNVDLTGVTKLTVLYRSPLLQQLKSIRLVDMPGIDSGVAAHEQAMKSYLHSAEACILVFSADEPVVKQSVADYLMQLRLREIDVSVVVTKCDKLTERDLERACSFLQQGIEQTLGVKNPQLICVSARGEVEPFAQLLLSLHRRAGEIAVKKLKSALYEACLPLSDYLSLRFAAERLQKAQWEAGRKTIQKNIKKLDKAFWEETQRFRQMALQCEQIVVEKLKQAVNDNAAPIEAMLLEGQNPAPYIDDMLCMVMSAGMSGDYQPLVRGYLKRVGVLLRLYGPSLGQNETASLRLDELAENSLAATGQTPIQMLLNAYQTTRPLLQDLPALPRSRRRAEVEKVVDTPGLNDPLYSRTEKTRRYLESCDVAFLLSRSSCFLDASDLKLLALQLPHKGIKSLVLVGSQFDSVLIDALPDFNSLEEAIDASAAELCAHARMAVEQSVRALRREGYPPVVLEVIEHCEKPVFVSALVEGMLGKSAGEYTEQETLVLRQLGCHGAPTEEQLRRISNFGEIRDLFDRLTLQKDALMQQKAEALVVFAQSELKLLLSEISRQLEGEITSLQSRQSAAKQRMDEVAAQINRIQSEVDGVFEEYLSPLDDALSHIQLELRDLQRDWAEPEYQESYEVCTHTQTVSAAKLILPWTWGKKRTEYQNQKIAYTYLDADQVGQNLRLLSELTASLQEGAFSPFADTSRLAAGLYSAAQRCCSLEGFGGTSEKLGQAITAAVGRLPEFRPPSARSERDLLPLNVEGQVRDPALQQKLCAASFAAAARLLEDNLVAANRYAALLRAAAQSAASEVKSVLCESLVAEQSRLLEELAHVQESLASLQEFCEIIYRYM